MENLKSFLSANSVELFNIVKFVVLVALACNFDKLGGF